MDSFPERIFVTGTDTEVGKTVVSAALCAGLPARYWKPVQAGTEPETDTERVRRWAGLSASECYPERYRLERAMSPHAAAEQEGIRISLEEFELPPSGGGRLVVEGAGGILVPLNSRHTMLDLILRLDLPVLVVARSGLGTINHSLMTLQILRQGGARVWGIVLNGKKHPSNEETIRHFSGVERLWSFPPMREWTPETLRSAFRQAFTL